MSDTTRNNKRRRSKTVELTRSKSSISKRKKIGRDVSDFDPKHVWVVPRRSAAFVDHNYHDYSTCSLPEDLDNVLDYSSDSSEAVEKNFSLKLHGILEKEEYKNYVTWMAHGRGFRILVPRIFEEVICPIYFNHSRYSTFMRQLNNYGFKLLTKGRDRNVHYHESFLRGLPHVVKYMPRPNNRRRLQVYADDEPDLYRVSELYPLPFLVEGGIFKSIHTGAISNHQTTCESATSPQETVVRKTDDRLLTNASFMHQATPPGEVLTNQPITSMDLAAATAQIDAITQQQQQSFQLQNQLRLEDAERYLIQQELRHRQLLQQTQVQADEEEGLLRNSLLETIRRQNMEMLSRVESTDHAVDHKKMTNSGAVPQNTTYPFNTGQELMASKFFQDFGAGI